MARILFTYTDVDWDGEETKTWVKKANEMETCEGLYEGVYFQRSCIKHPVEQEVLWLTLIYGAHNCAVGAVYHMAYSALALRCDPHRERIYVKCKELKINNCIIIIFLLYTSYFLSKRQNTFALEWMLYICSQTLNIYYTCYKWIITGFAIYINKAQNI